MNVLPAVLVRGARLCACAGVLLHAVPAFAQEEAGPSVDPAPPRVAVLAPMAPVRATSFDALTTYAAASPLPVGAVTESWPTFLGPRRDAHSRETKLRQRWDDGAGPPLLWTMERGHGYSCPVVAEGRLVYVHRDRNETVVECLDPETGFRFWRVAYPCAYRGRYIADNGARSSPAIHGGFVYVHGVEGRLQCIELSTGRVVWWRDLAIDFDAPDNFFGVVSSPLVVGNLLVVNVGAPGGPTVAGFELATGRMAWGTGDTWGAGCASPVAAVVHGRQRVFVLTGGESRPPSGGLMAIDPTDGAIDFAYPFRSRTFESVNGASPVIAGDRVFLSVSYNTGSAGLALEADGSYRQLWKERRLGQEFANPVYHDDHLYMVDGTSDRMGEVVCLDPESGQERSRTPVSFDESIFHDGSVKTLSRSIGEASMLHVDGAFLVLGDNGHLLWVDATPGGATVRARASLFRASESWTPPVVQRGLLFVCQNNRERFGRQPQGRRLLCFDLRDPA